MGTVEMLPFEKKIMIYSNFLLYGNLISETVRKDMEEETETLWNAPNGKINLDGDTYTVQFKINYWLFPTITKEDIVTNVNPKNNYIRIEAWNHENMSFVDGLGCNSGYYMIENLYKGSTTAAHEYGHTLGLEHPYEDDIRGKGVPSIMFARGTWVDPEYQYDPTIKAGEKGGTLHPMYRVVKQEDISSLKIEQLHFENNKSVLGKFTNRWHDAIYKT